MWQGGTHLHQVLAAYGSGHTGGWGGGMVCVGVNGVWCGVSKETVPRPSTQPGTHSKLGTWQQPIAQCCLRHRKGAFDQHPDPDPVHPPTHPWMLQHVPAVLMAPTRVHTPEG